MYYHRSRYYDCEMWQYRCVDPIGLNGGLNLYAGKDHVTLLFCTKQFAFYV
ncbi:hypothetical protein [Escherichia coli]|uniref:hypothetical protein n=1 Tax=Escherichia coli TaxID=562 RepID=UPI001750E516|nr:hypothetical protein [Escherichia coli]HAY5531586.1 hypothetical protein [Escherichia coli]